MRKINLLVLLAGFLAAPASAGFWGGGVSDHGHTGPGDGGVLSNPSITGGNISPTTVSASSLTLTGFTHIYASTVSYAFAEGTAIATFGSETLDTLGEFNGSTFTVTSAGNYQICVTGEVRSNGNNLNYGYLEIWIGGTSGTRIAMDGLTQTFAEGDTLNVVMTSACTMRPLTAGQQVAAFLTCNNNAGSVTCQFQPGYFSAYRIP